MFGRWLKGRTERSASAGSRRDLERFVESLRRQTAEELGTLVATAALIRTRMRSEGHFADDMLRVASSPEQALLTQRLGHMVTTYKNAKQPAEMAGTLVWLHTLRALAAPQLRILGRQLWEQLERGQPYAQRALRGIEVLSGKPLPLGAQSACDFIPDDLDPIELAIRRTPQNGLG